jgi:hypothetical protein
LRWSANDCFPSQLPIAIGDVVAITNTYGHAIVVDGSDATSFIDLKLFAAPDFGPARCCCSGFRSFRGHGRKAPQRIG